MVDGAHPGANRGLDSGRAVGMGRDLSAPARRFLHRGLDLGVGILLPPRLDAFRENRAGRHDLDEVGTVFEIGPNRFRDLVRPVSEVSDQAVHRDRWKIVSHRLRRPWRKRNSQRRAVVVPAPRRH